MRQAKEEVSNIGGVRHSCAGFIFTKIEVHVFYVSQANPRDDFVFHFSGAWHPAGVVIVTVS